jgi:hypothetical protein
VRCMGCARVQRGGYAANMQCPAAAYMCHQLRMGTSAVQSFSCAWAISRLQEVTSCSQEIAYLLQP